MNPYSIPTFHSLSYCTQFSHYIITLYLSISFPKWQFHRNRSPGNKKKEKKKRIVFIFPPIRSSISSIPMCHLRCSIRAAYLYSSLHTYKWFLKGKSWEMGKLEKYLKAWQTKNPLIAKKKKENEWSKFKHIAFSVHNCGKEENSSIIHTTPFRRRAFSELKRRGNMREMLFTYGWEVVVVALFWMVFHVKYRTYIHFIYEMNIQHT